MSPSAVRINFDSRDSTSSPTYPASVRLVASPVTSGTLRYEARDLTRWVLPDPEGPISRMLLFSIRTLCKSGSATMGSGASLSQASTSLLKWLETPKASRLFAMSCPITCWSRWATRVLGDGIEARRASLEGRAGGADASRRIEAALKERDVGVETKITTDGLIFGHGDTKGRGVSGPPTLGGRIPPLVSPLTKLDRNSGPGYAVDVPFCTEGDSLCVVVSRACCPLPLPTKTVCTQSLIVTACPGIKCGGPEFCWLSLPVSASVMSPLKWNAA